MIYTLTITDDQSGTILEQRPLGDDETMTCDDYALAFMDKHRFESSIDNGYVPLGCGDFSVEIAEVPQSAVCWESKSYFFSD